MKTFESTAVRLIEVGILPTLRWIIDGYDSIPLELVEAQKQLLIYRDKILTGQGFKDE